MLDVLVDAAFVLVGLVVLAVGADAFVLSSARLAATMRISPVVIGAVVVGFGTGAPELLVSSSAAASGSLDVAVGNVVGSNLANLTLVLGVAGMIGRPETIPSVIRREAPLSLAAVALLAVVIQGGLSRVDGVILLAALAASVTLMLRATTTPAARGAPHADEALEHYVDEVEEFVEERGEHALADVAAAPRSRDVLRAAAGLMATVAGAQLLVHGAKGIATSVGLSGGFVGLTLVALGTSLPELVTAIQSARRGETALLAGNVLGSNVFNSTAVAGAAALIGPGGLDEPGLTALAAGSMVGVAALTWLFLGYGGRLRRWEAAILLAIYVATLPLAS